MVNSILSRAIPILASAMIVASFTPARAEEGCGPLSDITKQLATGKYHEIPIVHAIVTSGAMLIVYAAAGGATWTLVGVGPSRPEVGCLLGAGTDWATSPLPPPGNPS